MSISRDAQSTTSQTVVSNPSWTHTLAAGAKVIYIAIISGTGDAYTGVTINSVSATLVGKQNPATDTRFTYLFRLFSPPTGLVTIQTATSTTTDCFAVAESYLVTGTPSKDNSGANNAFATSVSVTFVVAAGAWAFAATRSITNTGSAGTNLTTIPPAPASQILDSGSTLTGGSTTFTLNDSASTGLALIVETFIESGGAASVPNKLVNINQSIVRSSLY